VSPGGGGEPALQFVEAAAGPHRRQGGGQRPPARRGVVDVVGGHQVDPGADGQIGQRVVAGGVERVTVVPQLDRHPVPPEPLHQPGQLPGRRRRPPVDQRRRNRPLAAPGQHLPVPAVQLGQLVEAQPGRALLPRHLRPAEGAGQAGVAGRVTSQDDQVSPRRIRDARRGRGRTVEGDLGPEDGRQAHLVGRLGETDHPVEAVVVAEGQGRQTEPGRLLDQLLGVGGPVQEAEVGVAVQLGVGHAGARSRRPQRFGGRAVGLALARPGRAVTTVGVERVVARASV
jgi:hypothetical protein